MQAGSHRGRQGRQGSTGCHGAQVQAAAILGCSKGRQWDAGKVQGSKQGVGRVLPATASCVQPGTVRVQTGCRGPWPGCRGHGKGAGGVRAGRGVTLEEGGDVPGGDAPLLHELSQSHLQEEDGDAAHEDDEQVGDEEDAWGRGQGAGSAAAVPPAPPFAPPLPRAARPDAANGKGASAPSPRRDVGQHGQVVGGSHDPPPRE